MIGGRGRTERRGCTLCSRLAFDYASGTDQDSSEPEAQARAQGGKIWSIQESGRKNPLRLVHIESEKPDRITSNYPNRASSGGPLIPENVSLGAVEATSHGHPAHDTALAQGP